VDIITTVPSTRNGLDFKPDQNPFLVTLRTRERTRKMKSAAATISPTIRANGRFVAKRKPIAVPRATIARKGMEWI